MRTNRNETALTGIMARFRAITGFALRASLIAVAALTSLSISANAQNVSGGSGGYLPNGACSQTLVTIPAGARNVRIDLNTPSPYTDHDINLFNGGTFVLGYGGMINSQSSTAGYFQGDRIVWSGWAGSGGYAGRENVTIAGPTRNAYRLVVSAYSSGDSSINWSWTQDGGQTLTAKAELVNKLASNYRLLENSWGDWCKTFLQNKFATTADGLGMRTASGNYLRMPANWSSTNDSLNWRWQEPFDSPFVRVYQIAPSQYNTQATFMSLLRQVRRGDFLQMKWQSSGIQHTVFFQADYSNDWTPLSWSDSNYYSDKIVHTGTHGMADIATFAKAMSKSPIINGATLYRLKDDIRRQ